LRRAFGLQRLDEAWRRIGPDKGIQGNLDPAVMLAPMEVVEQEAAEMLAATHAEPAGRLC
jgi:uroporphyrinogen decarboxylase